MGASPCLVTIHGIGFQQPPVDGRPGYADELHRRLHDPLGERLGDDPERTKKGESGPVYVASEVHGSRDQGLARLDPGKPLAPPEKTSHVALVYSPSEPLKPRLGSVADTLIRAIVAHDRYVSALGAIKIALEDGWAMLHERKHGAGESSTLRPREDLPGATHHHRLAALLHGGAAQAPSEPGLLGVFRALEDDMATYVVRNDLRERVRGFVEEALLALAARDDVSSLIVNTHSQGTMIGWDVLCRVPFQSWSDRADPQRSILRQLVTAGSPIRKYVDLFAWGDQIGQLRLALAAGMRWSNFWDARDPVADPLDPARAWRPGEPVEEDPPRDIGLLRETDPASGAQAHVKVYDTRIDNIENSAGGGLQAHDYWNNQREFVVPLARLIEAA